MTRYYRRKFKVIQDHRFWCQSKAHNTFQLTTNINLGHISYRSRDIDAFRSEIVCFPNPALAWRPTAGCG